jgi:hypothetical protein
MLKYITFLAGMEPLILPYKLNTKQAMIAMDQTIAGAASGETAGNLRRRRVHNLRQKDRRVRVLFVILSGRVINIICYSYDP